MVRAIERGIELATGGNGIWQGSRHEAKLLELASSINLEQAEELAAQLAAYRVNGEHVRSPVYALDVARRLAQSPSVRSLAGSHDRDGAAG